MSREASPVIDLTEDDPKKAIDTPLQTPNTPKTPILKRTQKRSQNATAVTPVKGKDVCEKVKGAKKYPTRRTGDGSEIVDLDQLPEPRIVGDGTIERSTDSDAGGRESGQGAMSLETEPIPKSGSREPIQLPGPREAHLQPTTGDKPTRDVPENGPKRDGSERQSQRVSSEKSSQRDSSAKKSRRGVPHHDVQGNTHTFTSTLPALVPDPEPHHYYRHQDIDLSPIKRPRKSVAFSDNLASDASDHWGSDAPTPQRSILKTLHALLHQFSTARCLPRSRDFWHAGTIVVLEARLPDLTELVAGCAEVLGDAAFDRKFEVYATLNQVCKSNDAATLAEIFVGGSPPSPTPLFGGFAFAKNKALKTGTPKGAHKTAAPAPTLLLVGARLVRLGRRDILAVEAGLFRAHKNDPFQARILGQALKVAAFWLAVPAINNSLPHEDVEWFYAHACDMLAHPAISKSLVLPYLCLLKECHYSAHKRPELFTTTLPRRMLDAVLSIRSFPSSSLVNEKLACLKSLVQNFPSSMADSFSHWFPGLVLSLCDTHFHLHAKTVATGITSLLEAARTYLDAPKVGRMARGFLDAPLPLEPQSFADNSVVPTSVLAPAVDFVCASLKDMIDAGNFKFAMDIWVGLLLLTSHPDLPLEKWSHTPSWLLVHRYCFNVASISAKTTALSSWKAVIYKITCVDLQEASVWLRASGQLPGAGYDAVKPKLRLLLHLFANMSSSGYRAEVVDALHQAAIAIFFNLLGTMPQPLGKQLTIYWDRIFLPVFTNFYFNKELATPHMHQLGYAVLQRLLKPMGPTNVFDTSYSRTRCLSNEYIPLSEIAPLMPRWVHLQFETILPLLATVFKLEVITVEEKLACINVFLNSIKYVTKNEVLPSNPTLDLIDNLPYVLQPLFETTNPSYDEIFKLIITLNDTFSAPNLVTDSKDGSGSYLVILAYCSKTFTSHQLNAILSMLQGAVGERKGLLFLSNLCRVCKKWKCHEDVYAFIGDCLTNKKHSRFSHNDMILLSYIFASINTNFAGPAKKLIQQIVLLKAEEFENTVTELKLANWNIRIFKFFVTLMHDAPFAHLKRTSLELMRMRLQNPVDFSELFVLLTESKFDHEIHSLRTEICHNIHSCDSQTNKLLWRAYLKLFEGPPGHFDDLLTTSLQLGFEVHDYAKNKWDDLPKLKKAWREKFNDEIWESGKTVSIQSDQLSSRQGELESMIASDMMRHSAAKPIAQESTTPISNSDRELLEQSAIEKNSGETDLADSSLSSVGSDIFVRESPPAVLETSPTTIKTGDMVPPSTKPIVQKRKISLDSDTRRRSKRIQTRLVGEEGDIASDSSIVIELSAEASLDVPSESIRDHANVVKFELLDEPIQPMSESTVTDTTKQVSDSEDSSRIKDKCLSGAEKDMEIVSSLESDVTKSGDTNETFISMKDTNFQDQSTANNTSNESGDLSIGTVSDRRLSVVDEIQEGGEISTELTSIEQMRNYMERISSAELVNLTANQKYDLETEMMQFILRMRQVSQEAPA